MAASVEGLGITREWIRSGLFNTPSEVLKKIQHFESESQMSFQEEDHLTG